MRILVSDGLLPGVLRAVPLFADIIMQSCLLLLQAVAFAPQFVSLAVSREALAVAGGTIKRLAALRADQFLVMIAI